MNHSKLYDQLVFTFGVFWVAITTYLSGAHPELATQIFTGKCLVLLGMRAYVYFSTKNKYFMWDFCYFTNFLILAYLHLFYHSEFLFKVVFACSLGPLSWAVATWRNSLVFHSLDKMTSVFIHLGPPLLMYELRWMQEMPLHYGTEMSWTEAIVYPMGFYFLWQTYYYLRIVLWTGQSIEENGMWTSYHYLTSEKNRGSVFYDAYFVFGKDWSRTMFMIIQAFYTMLTLLPVRLFYHYKWLHFLFYVAMALVCTWNGASYYFHVFAKAEKQSAEAVKED